jgi:hypothetical protein
MTYNVKQEPHTTSRKRDVQRRQSTKPWPLRTLESADRAEESMSASRETIIVRKPVHDRNGEYSDA